VIISCPFAGVTKLRVEAPEDAIGYRCTRQRDLDAKENRSVVSGDTSRPVVKRGSVRRERQCRAR
jgi:hypothetical protein